MKFDEEIIAEHDKDRGTRQKISEPKTPYANEDEAMVDEDSSQPGTGGDHVMSTQEASHVIEDEVRRHLEEAERNKQLNA